MNKKAKTERRNEERGVSNSKPTPLQIATALLCQDLGSSFFVDVYKCIDTTQATDSFDPRYLLESEIPLEAYDMCNNTIMNYKERTRALGALPGA